MLRALIEEALEKRSAQEWISIINESGVPCGPVLNLKEALALDQTRELGLIQQVQHPLLGEMAVLGKAVKVGDDPRDIRRHPPLLGEHTQEILSELGYSDSDIEALCAAGAAADARLEVSGR